MSDFLDWFLRETKKLIPPKTYALIEPYYHYTLSLFGALIYLFPSRRIFVVGVTGTKGKTSVTELINAILEEAGYKTALASTMRFKIADSSNRNMYKMTMPGRFALQRFIRNAVNQSCEYAIVEMTSEGVKQFRHKFIYLDALIFTNISPEHIESHGSYEKYLEAKLKLRDSLGKSRKRPRYIIANKDDKESSKFLDVLVENKIEYGLAEAQPFRLAGGESTLTIDKETIKTTLPGEFNIYNIVSAAAFAKTQNISASIIKKGVEKLKFIRGRMEKVTIEGMPNIDVIVDYAHTTDSLKKVYETISPREMVCVLGGTGGGRDRWKRPEMGRLAASYCRRVILTDEDPYDENPLTIIEEIKKGIPDKDKCEVVLDRREAINRALKDVKEGETIIITGKGTDPYIMGPHGTKTPWDDAQVAREELGKHLSKK